MDQSLRQMQLPLLSAPPGLPWPGQSAAAASNRCLQFEFFCMHASQLPRLATGRAAVNNGYSHRMFDLCSLFRGRRGRALHLKLCILFAASSLVPHEVLPCPGFVNMTLNLEFNHLEGRDMLYNIHLCQPVPPSSLLHMQHM